MTRLEAIKFVENSKAVWFTYGEDFGTYDRESTLEDLENMEDELWGDGLIEEYEGLMTYYFDGTAEDRGTGLSPVGKYSINCPYSNNSMGEIADGDGTPLNDSDWMTIAIRNLIAAGKYSRQIMEA